MLKYIDPDRLNVGDVVGVTDMSWFAEVERWTINGPINMFNQSICTHICIVCDRGMGLKYFAEMMYPTIELNNLEKYDHKKPLGHICFVGRHPAFNDHGLQMAANDFLLESHAKLIKYDILELLKFWDLPVPDDPKKLICSDLAREMFRRVGIIYPNTWNMKNSPWDWQSWKSLIHVPVRS